jgi:hypothetical protein
MNRPDACSSSLLPTPSGIVRGADQQLWGDLSVLASRPPDRQEERPIAAGHFPLVIIWPLTNDSTFDDLGKRLHPMTHQPRPPARCVRERAVDEHDGRRISGLVDSDMTAPFRQPRKSMSS